MRRAAALAVCAGLGALSCESILGVDFGSARLAPETSGSVDGSQSCNPLTAPARPANMPPATDGVEFTVVVKDVDFGDEVPDAGVGGYFDVGRDQDGICTGRYGDGAGCTPLPWIGITPKDGPRGEDNSIALLMLGQPATFGVQPVGTIPINQNVVSGTDSPMGVIRVRAFGGPGNDDHIEVDWFAVGHLAGSGDASAAPAFDDSDVWPVLEDTVQDPSVAKASDTVSKYRDPNAFALRSQLVAHFPVVHMSMRNILFEVTDVVLTADLERNPATQKWTLSNGVISGRADTDGLLHVIPRIAYQVYGVPLCKDDQANYPNVKRFICTSADLPASGPGNASVPCSASSLGMRFGTAPASLGALIPEPPSPSGCTAATDPGADVCATEQSP